MTIFSAAQIKKQNEFQKLERQLDMLKRDGEIVFCHPEDCTAVSEGHCALSGRPANSSVICEYDSTPPVHER